MNASILVYQADGSLYASVSEQRLARLQSAGLAARVVRHPGGAVAGGPCGDVWVMRDHQLLCGDATSIEVVQAVLAGGLPARSRDGRHG